MIGVLDLDGFKEINDRYGHHVGDQVLAVVAARLTGALGREADVARRSGDEFLLIWYPRPTDPARTALRVLTSLSRPLIIDGHLLRPCGSLGIAVRGPHLRGSALLRAADHAMYTAKSLGPGAVHLYPGLYPPPPTDRRGARPGPGTSTAGPTAGAPDPSTENPH